MTEEDARELVVRLTALWMHTLKAEEGRLTSGWSFDDGGFGFEVGKGQYAFTFEWGDSCEFDYTRTADRLYSTRKGSKHITAYVKGGCIFAEFEGDTLSFRSGRAFEHSGEDQAEFDVFAALWLPTVSRTCYLAGLPIECTAHERIEWLRYAHENELLAYCAPQVRELMGV